MKIAMFPPIDNMPQELRCQNYGDRAFNWSGRGTAK
jgi:hypothetical protein